MAKKVPQLKLNVIVKILFIQTARGKNVKCATVDGAPREPTSTSKCSVRSSVTERESNLGYHPPSPDPYPR